MKAKIISKLMLKESISDIGEKELIKRLSYFMPPNQTCDDCGYLKINNKELLINTDLMVENTHFCEKTLSAKDIGWKITTTNFSDLISSGCDEIIGINIGLILQPTTEWQWVKDVYEGINEALTIFGGSIIGGDCSRGDKKSITITAIGKQGELYLRRYACEPGEVLLTSGIHGMSKLGFLLKSGTQLDEKLYSHNELIKKAIKAFCRPEPKIKTLKNIIKAKTKKDKDIIGCTDSSDGLFQAIKDLSLESKCNAIIDYNKLPKDYDWPSGQVWDEYYFYGGEDYEILFALPKDWANTLLRLDPSVREIGYFEKGNGAIEIKNCPHTNFFSKKVYNHF